jgi:uncharacterized protein involved in oxidation of intracellular sulfur
MKTLFVINDGPYGTEKAYNALRLAMAMQKEQSDLEINIFLMADAVTCAVPAQSTPRGYYSIETMIKTLIKKRTQVKACGSCCSARGIDNIRLIDGVEISTITQLAKWSIDADKILTF